MQIQIIDPRLNKDSFKPATKGSAGIDLYAVCDIQLVLRPGRQLRIYTGIKIAIPQQWVGIVSPRSSWGAKGLVLGNNIGIIDSDYRGVISLIMLNRNKDTTIIINPMDRVAQMILVPHYEHCCVTVSEDDLEQTDRGEKGFGSTGK